MRWPKPGPECFRVTCCEGHRGSTRRVARRAASVRAVRHPGSEVRRAALFRGRDAPRWMDARAAWMGFRAARRVSPRRDHLLLLPPHGPRVVLIFFPSHLTPSASRSHKSRLGASNSHLLSDRHASTRNIDIAFLKAALGRSRRRVPASYPHIAATQQRHAIMVSKKNSGSSSSNHQLYVRIATCSQRLCLSRSVLPARP